MLIVGHGLRFGTHRTLPTIAGAEAAVALLLLAAGSGVGALLAAAPAAFSAVKLCGALYLIWLGLRQWCARVPGAYAQENAPKNAAAHDIPRHQKLLAGFLCNASNPKSIVFMAAMLPQFMQTTRPIAPQLFILLLTTLVIDSAVMLGYAAVAAHLARWLRSPAAKRAQNRLCGGVLMFMGAALLLAGQGAE